MQMVDQIASVKGITISHCFVWDVGVMIDGPKDICRFETPCFVASHFPKLYQSTH